MLVRIIYGVVFCVLYSNSIFAEIYIREYTYNASEADSKLTSRIIALDQVKILLLQEVGTYIRQELDITKDGSGGTYASEDVETITAGLTKVDILSEKWDGETYYLKAKIEADTEQVLNAIDEFKKSSNKDKRRQIEAQKSNQRELKQSRKEVAHLKQLFENYSGGSRKEELHNQYLRKVELLSTAEMFSRGFESAQLGRYADAVHWYRKAAEQGHTEAQFELGLKYGTGKGIKRDYYEMVSWFLKAAEQGHAYAEYALGSMYEIGRGVEQDEQKAFYWIQQSADQGFPEAQYDLSVLYYVGRGVNEDDQKALYWLKKAAYQGLDKAQYELGLKYLMNQSVPLDGQKAYQWIKKSAEQGYTSAENYLGFLYERGKFIERDYQQAASWYHKAAEHGSDGAKFTLISMYKEGRGVNKDLDVANKMYKELCDIEDQSLQCKLYRPQ